MSRTNSILRDLRYFSGHPVFKVAILTFFGNVLVAIFLFSIWIPLHRDYASMSKRTLENRRLISENEQRNLLSKRYTEAAKWVPVIEKKLKTSMTQAQMIEEFSSLASRCHVKFLSESYNKDRNDSSKLQLHADLVVQGDYYSLRNYIDGISDFPVLVEIQEIRFSSENRGGSIKGLLRVVGNSDTTSDGS